MDLLSIFELPVNVAQDDSEAVVLALHSTSELIAAGLKNGKIQVFVKNGEGNTTMTLEAHQGPVWSLTSLFSDTGSSLISAGNDAVIKLWSVASGHVSFSKLLTGHAGTVRHLATLNGSTIVSASFDWTLRIWDVIDGKCIHVLSGHKDRIRCLIVHDKFIVSGSLDSLIKIWDSVIGECLRTLEGHGCHISAMLVADGGRRLVTGDERGKIIIWDLHNGSHLTTLSAIYDPVSVPAESSAIIVNNTTIIGLRTLDGSRFLSSNADGSVRAWSLKTFEQNWSSHRGGVVFGVEVAENRKICTAGSDGRYRVWNCDSNRGDSIEQPLFEMRTDGIWVLTKVDQRMLIAFVENGITRLQVRK